jgi:putative PIN family toxin of toxin-antitoxin system
MTLRVVLDTNVVVSAFLNRTGNEALILRLGLSGIFQVCVSEVVLAEYKSVLSRSQFHNPPRLIVALIADLESSGVFVQPTDTLRISDHAPDNRFYECADAAKADYIVTGNTKHFKKPHKTTKIITARQLLEIVAPGN